MPRLRGFNGPCIALLGQAQLLLGTLALRDVPVDDESGILVVADADALRSDMGVEAGTILALPDDLKFDRPSGQQIRILRKVSRLQFRRRDQIPHAPAHRLFGRIAERPREFLVDAQIARIAKGRQDDGVRRQLEQLVQVHLLLLDILQCALERFVGPRELRRSFSNHSLQLVVGSMKRLLGLPPDHDFALQSHVLRDELIEHPVDRPGKGVERVRSAAHRHATRKVACRDGGLRCR